jgi:hypothetical protein
MDLLKEGEDTLGADILLAYQQDQQAQAASESISGYGLRVADLNESQLECLQGLEQKMEAVVIAYAR